MRVIINFGYCQIFEFLSKKDDNITIFDLKQIIFEIYHFLRFRGSSKGKAKEYGCVKIHTGSKLFGYEPNDKIPINIDINHGNSIPYLITAFESSTNDKNIESHFSIRVETDRDYKKYFGFGGNSNHSSNNDIDNSIPNITTLTQPNVCPSLINPNIGGNCKCNILSKCLQIDQSYVNSINNKENSNDDDAKVNFQNELYHLSSYQHFNDNINSINKYNLENQMACKNGTKCPSYEKILQNIESDYDRIHMHLYYHPSRPYRNRMTQDSNVHPIQSDNTNQKQHHHFQSQSQSQISNSPNTSVSVNNSKKYKFGDQDIRIVNFSYNGLNEIVMARYSGRWKQDKKRYLAEIERAEPEAIVLLIQEVINNGFEQDLIPVDNNVKFNNNINIGNNISNNESSCTQLNLNFFNPSIEVNRIYNWYAQANSNHDDQSIVKLKQTDFNYILKALKSKYKIFDIVQRKLKHPRHKFYNCPLSELHMLSLVLYCNGGCNYHLCECQRNDTYDEYWPLFDWYLNQAIEILSNHEIHNQYIYTGICTVQFRFDKKNKKHRYSRTCALKSNVSFTTSIDVAKEFRGNRGMIIRLNMKDSLWVRYKYFKVCDVSWISKFPSEKEILAFRGSHFDIKFGCIKMEKTAKNQWIYSGDDFN